MSYDPSPNPYASPAYVAPVPDPTNVPPHVAQKAEAIIKDAGQFWLAILICIFCSALGALIIGPWYFVRLMQWNSLAREQPSLLAPASHGSLAQRFQGAKVKLIIGICAGVVILGLVGLYILALALVPPVAG